MGRKSITDPVIKQLFAVSGNKCCFPGCAHLVFNREEGVLIGEMCHIRAVNSRGPRYDAEFPEEKINSFENLIVFCPTHHETVDKNFHKYTVAVLLEMKSQHESQFYERAELFNKNPIEPLGEISGVDLRGLEVLSLKASSQKTVLPKKKIYSPPENYIHRYVSPVKRGEKEKSFKSNSLLSLINEESSLTILGVAGSGKSIELAHLAYIHSQPDSNLYPVKIRLNSLTSQEIEELLRIEYPHFDEVPKDRLLILLDALDEVHADFQDIVSSKIELLSKKFEHSKIVVTCRNNFYTTETDNRRGKLEGFNSFLIQPLEYSSIYFYLKDKLHIPPEEFIEKLKKRKFYDLLYSPFFLVHLVEIFKVKNEIPSSRKIIFEHLINQRIQVDQGKFVNAGINIQDYTYRLQLKMQELAIVAECLGRNYLDDRTEVQRLVLDQTLLGVIKRTFLFNKSTVGNIWEFEHNSFQEFLAAQFLMELSFEEIKKYISFSPDFLKIQPSWLNTVSFLFSLIDAKDEKFNQLVSWILEIEPDVLIRFEKEQLDLELREKLFYQIYEEFEVKKIIIRNEKFESYDLALFVSDSTNVVEYLINKIENSTERLIILEALRILHYFEWIGVYSEKVRDILKSKIISKEISDEIKYECLNALSDLEISDRELTEIILRYNNLESSQYLRTGFYRYLETSNQTEDYLPIILRGVELIEGVKVSRNGASRNEKPFLSSEKLILERLFEHINSKENINAVFSWASEYDPPSSLNSVFFKVVEIMLKKAIEIYAFTQGVFDLVLRLFISFSRQHHKELGESFRDYFGHTNSKLKAFKILYQEWLNDEKDGFELTYPMAVICDEDCLKFIVTEITSGNFIEPRTWQFRNVLGFDGRREMFERYQQELLKIDQEKYTIKRVDYEELNKARRFNDVALLFSKEEFLREVQRIFKEEANSEGRLTKNELYNYNRTNFSYDEMTNNIVVEALRSQAQEKGFVEIGEIEDLATDDSSWKWFQIHNLVEFDQKVEDFQFTSKAFEFVLGWVTSQIKSANFQTALEYRNENRYHYRKLELFISYFIQRFDIKVSEEIYLDLLYLQCFLLPTKLAKHKVDEEEISPNTFDFVVEKLGLEKVVKRALENLQGNALVPGVRQSHFKFCQKFKVRQAAPLILEEIFSVDWDGFDQRVLITQFIELSQNMDSLFERFDQLPKESKIHAANKMAESGHFIVLEKVVGLIADEDSEEVKYQLVQILFLIDEATGFSYQKEWILRNKRFPEHYGKPIPFTSATIEDLIEIFEDALKFNYGTGRWSNRNDYLNALLEKGSADKTGYLKVRSEILKWLDKYEDVKSLHYQLEDLKQKFYSNLSQSLTFEQAVKQVRKSQASKLV